MIRDRRQLSQDGIIIVVVTLRNGEVVSGPDMVSRGFVYVRESEQLMEKIKIKVNEAMEICLRNQVSEWALIKKQIKDKLGKYIYDELGRRPMIIPIIMEV